LEVAGVTPDLIRGRNDVPRAAHHTTVGRDAFAVLPSAKLWRFRLRRNFPRTARRQTGRPLREAKCKTSRRDMEYKRRDHPGLSFHPPSVILSFAKDLTPLANPSLPLMCRNKNKILRKAQNDKKDGTAQSA